MNKEETFKLKTLIGLLHYIDDFANILELEGILQDDDVRSHIMEVINALEFMVGDSNE